VGLDDRATDREAHPHASRLRGEEGVEQGVEIAGVNPGPGVPYFNQHGVRVASVRGDFQLARPLADLIHRLDRVDKQIQHDLLQLDAIGLNEGQRGGELRPHLDGTPLQLVLRDPHDFADDEIHVHELFPGRNFLDERANAAENLGRAPAVVDDQCEIFTGLFQIGSFGPQVARTGARIYHDSCERLVDLVSDRRRQLANEHDPVGACEVRLRLTQRSFGAEELFGAGSCIARQRRDHGRRRQKENERDTVERIAHP
jgi:hypothetical protein